MGRKVGQKQRCAMGALSEIRKIRGSEIVDSVSPIASSALISLYPRRLKIHAA